MQTELPQRCRWNCHREIAKMETEISPRETDETVGDVETRISTEKNYEEHPKTLGRVPHGVPRQLPRVSDTSAAWMTCGGTGLATARHVSGGQRAVKEGAIGSDRVMRGHGWLLGRRENAGRMRINSGSE
ncbi:hypothetical protein PIB30_064820 [Stylosanthes scabra]|uniref:Uncharacterized protein n=1 Tax=Stylosanthes scabra TaxID=79078 RepID=A0ABU6VMT5_9FABA|nr:hypothetical protein [Stylosanthes scabra]